METFNKKRVIALMLAGVMTAGTLTGCNQVVGTDATSYPLQSALTKQEVLDYYEKSLDYDTVISRNIKLHVNNYVTKEVSDSDRIANVQNALNETVQLLSSDDYIATDESSRYLTTSMYHYIRALLNDKKLTNQSIESIETALGYYFVDVNYNIEAAEIGTFKPTISLIGMNGAYVYSSYYGKDSIDGVFIEAAIQKMNDYFVSINAHYVAAFDGERFYITEGDPSGGNDTFSYNPVTEDTENSYTEETDENNQNTQYSEYENTSTTVEESSSTSTSSDETEQTNNRTDKGYSSRQLEYDLNLFNKVVGAGTSRSYIPELSEIYNIPAQSGGISGIGLYPSGGLGLTIFNLNRNELAGTCKLRFLYKEDLEDPTMLTLENIYVIYYEITSGYSDNNDNNIPEFLENDFEQLIERADRAMVDTDITGMMTGNIFGDVGAAVLRGYEEANGSLLRQISTLRRILSRNIEKNAYLVEIETYRMEGDETADRYPSYKDKVYATIEQIGSKFVITDYMIMNRQLMTEPDIDPDTSTAKRIVALGLTGDISDTDLSDINDLVQDLYTSSTYRKLYGPYTVNDVEYQRGMYDCFDPDVEMLSSSKKEELNARLRNMLVKYGTNRTANMYGQITEKIGGTDKQAEFITEEVITYQGRQDGHYMKCYYLVSKMEGKWVIDGIQILSEEDISGDTLTNIVNRLKSE